MKFAAWVILGGFIYIILVGLIIVFIHSATKKVQPKIKKNEKQEQFIKDNKLYKRENIDKEK
ncbi:hypothetical protein NNC19_05310 [Clostridium sp. SHJSY1]|uniref:hypothetical protein n=1 Tax=Clostridium sp. SHJSY1 TaxID=2942483 RepID=UPI0028752BBE|nr:hypothetical protein [Clostridium sp. SHJSY1]MDS0525092.1 hypothetical protein [Clostridium sp. SHJSY1]